MNIIQMRKDFYAECLRGAHIRHLPTPVQHMLQAVFRAQADNVRLSAADVLSEFQAVGA